MISSIHGEDSLFLLVLVQKFLGNSKESTTIQPTIISMTYSSSGSTLKMFLQEKLLNSD